MSDLEEKRREALAPWQMTKRNAENNLEKYGWKKQKSNEAIVHLKLANGWLQNAITSLNDNYKTTASELGEEKRKLYLIRNEIAQDIITLEENVMNIEKEISKFEEIKENAQYNIDCINSIYWQPGCSGLTGENN